MKNKKDVDFGEERLKTAQQSVEKRFKDGDWDNEFPYLKDMGGVQVQRFKDFQIIAELKTDALNLAKRNKSKDQDKFESLRNKIFELQNIYDLTYLQDV